MKWVLFGHRGWIGGQVVDLLTIDDETIIRAEVRADDEYGVRELLSREKPDRVISMVGRTHGEGFTTIDYLEHKDKLFENVRDNMYSPFVLATICSELDIHLTHVNTGCIFSYDDEHALGGNIGFTEASLPNFFGSSYSVVKGFTDRMMKLIKGPILTLRIRMPITADRNPRNFITKITAYDKICSMPNSMTVLPDLLPIMLDMARNKVVGTVNLTNPGVISHNEILEMYRDIIDPYFVWENFSIEEQSTVLKSDRSNNYLDTTLLQTMYPRVKHIHESVKDILLQMKRNVKAT